MSERLLICYEKNIEEDDDFFDCIYTEKGTLQLLLDDWLNYDAHTGTFFNLLRIQVRDKELLPLFMKDFCQLKHYVPIDTLMDCVSLSMDGVKIQENKKYKEFVENLIHVSLCTSLVKEKR